MPRQVLSNTLTAHAHITSANSAVLSRQAVRVILDIGGFGQLVIRLRKVRFRLLMLRPEAARTDFGAARLYAAG